MAVTYHSPVTRRRRLWVALSVVALLSTGCADDSRHEDSANTSTGPDASTVRGGVAVVNWVNDPTSLDPLRYNSWAAYNVYTLVYNTLLRYDEQGQLHPELASALPIVSDDGLRYAIRIRENVKWHDGRALTAKDVAFTIRAILEPRNASMWNSALSSVVAAEETDSSTLTLTLSHAYTPLLGILAQIPIISSAYPYVPNKTWVNAMTGTGPFKFVRYEPGSKITLKRNDNYFKDGLPHLDGIEFQMVPDDVSRVINVINGSAHVVPMPPYDLLNLLESRDVKVTVTPGSAQMPIIFPSEKGGRPTANVDFRKAIAWAIDRQQIINNVYHGNAVPQSTLLASGFPNWDPDVGNAYGTVADLGKARAALIRSGVDPSRPVTLICQDQFRIQQVATYIQANLKKLGLNVKISQETAASYLHRFASGDYDLILLNLEVGQSSGFTENYVYAALHSGEPSNLSKFDDPVMDDLLLKAVSGRTDPKAAWRLVQQRDLEMVPLIPIVTARYVEADSPKLRNYTPSSLQNLRNLEEAYLPP